MTERSPTERAPLQGTVLRRGLVEPGGFFTEVRVVAETGSTNADVAAAARAGAPEGLVVIAENQAAGRGRLGRAWQAPPRASITLSVLLRPSVPVARLGWLTLLAGVSLVESVERVAGVDAALKWPNDLLVRVKGEGGEYAKCAGILAEALETAVGRAAVPGHEPSAVPVLPPSGPAVALGIGLNVSQRADELPGTPSALPATSLALEAATCINREALILELLGTLTDWYRAWCAVGGDAAACGLLASYRDCCDTLGREVTVSTPDGTGITGTATDIDDDGRLLVMTADGVHTLAAGDVRHVRARRP